MSDEQNKDMEMEETTIITLVDDNDEEREFEVVDSAELDGQEYVALVPVLDEPQEVLEDSGELVILKVVEEDGEEFFDAIEDEEEFDRISAIFMKRLEDVFDFED